MGKVTFISAAGDATTVDVQNGVSLMQASLDNGIDGIVAECGGACSCATCHVYVSEEWTAKAPVSSTIERDMLECVIDPEPNSRLSCQLVMDDELDGIVVRIPESQY